ncbi:MAG: anhydro-N-acetylmuramic acid kinase [Halioglobus sp.]|nr:anhydro-N-acetylmuramic acid kinase [Halioglobus sp.]
MSGTSMDAVDSALLRFDGDTAQLAATLEYPVTDSLRDELGALCQPGDDEINRLGRLDLQLGELFAHAALALLEHAAVDPGEVSAIGSHGQTVRHEPPVDGVAGFTLQIGDPNTIAERTGITTVADFRRRDMACGGQGAPLVPAFHAQVFAAPGVDRAIVNIGGIANATVLQGEQLLAGFDTGPGNTLLDQWYSRHREGRFDRDGAWSAQGEVRQDLLQALLGEPYFARSGPRSTGRELFNLPWLERHLAGLPAAPPVDVQATLAELTAVSIARALQGAAAPPDEVYICGGGAHNGDLLGRLRAQLPASAVADTQKLGIHPDWVEAATFAWLARRRLQGLCGNAAVVTGAAGPRVLGAVYPA